jgi:hypothetical protein
MTICAELSERMPAVGLGREVWTDVERAHLADCADCRAEWEVVRAGAALGALLPIGDPNVSAARVLLRVQAAQAQDRARQRLRTSVVIGAAAAALVVLAVWTGRAGRPIARPSDSTAVVAPSVAAGPRDTGSRATMPHKTDAAPQLTSPTSTPVALALPELDGLDAEALDSVLRVLDQPVAGVGSVEAPDADDGGDRALEQALSGQEG